MQIGPGDTVARADAGGSRSLPSERAVYCLITQTLISGFTSAWSRIGTR